MKNTSDTLILYKNNKFFDVSDHKIEMSADEISGKKRIKLVLSDDNVFYYIYKTNLKNFRKSKEALHNHLLTLFPEKMCEKYSVVRVKGNLVACFVKQDVVNNLSEAHIGSNLQILTTEALSCIEKNEITDEQIDELFLKNKSCNLQDINRDTPHLNPTDFGLNVKTGRKSQSSKLAVTFLVAVIFLSLGQLFRLQALKDVYSEKSQSLNSIYSLAGVSNVKDPYGMLLFKVNQLQGKSESSLFEKLSNVLENKTDGMGIKSISYSDNALVIDGIADSEKDLNAYLSKFGERINLVHKNKEQSSYVFQAVLK